MFLSTLVDSKQDHEADRNYVGSRRVSWLRGDDQTTRRQYPSGCRLEQSRTTGSEAELQKSMEVSCLMHLWRSPLADTYLVNAIKPEWRQLTQEHVTCSGTARIRNGKRPNIHMHV